tara:strand:- start:530 stop:1051 length:522 start_codon:yes stop_codon:yes gene_type:complete
MTTKEIAGVIIITEISLIIREIGKAISETKNVCLTFNKGQALRKEIMKYLRCPKCNIEEKVYEINIRKEATLAMYNEFNPKVRISDGLNIYPLYCFVCKSVTEWASDPFNNSNKAFKGIEYFETRKSNKKDLKEINAYADTFDLQILKDKVKNKIKMKKPKKRKSWYQKLFAD